MESIPTWQEGGTMPDKSISGKESCWNCFKIYQLTVDNSQFKTGSKVSTFELLNLTFLLLIQGFCSEPCYFKYNQANTIRCRMATCQKPFLKQDGAFLHGRWFCNEIHAQQDPDIQRIEEIKKKIDEVALEKAKGAGQAEQEEDEDYVIDL